MSCGDRSKKTGKKLYNSINIRIIEDITQISFPRKNTLNQRQKPNNLASVDIDFLYL